MTVSWEELLKAHTINRGWHLARLDTKGDFSEDLYSTDVYGLDLTRQISETIDRLQTNTYQPRPLFKIEVPKGALAFRPGAVIPIQDRTVLFAILLVIAGEIDKKLPKSVFSWRLKDPIPKKGPIFSESDITDLPFLKKGTIRDEVDPFEGWYRLWPEFDRKTRRVYQEKGYRFLATSDIAAYFENIQLPILRDQLLRHVPNDVELVNLMLFFLESWCDKTTDGRIHHRGIPQGNAISSFLGNVFLLPLDEEFAELEKLHDIRYFRYMDDVRIFTKSREVARLCVLIMARLLRNLHLNVQTAKTKIYDENTGEISRLLIDDRVDDLSELIDDIQKTYKGARVPTTERSFYLKQLDGIARKEPRKGQKIAGAKKPLEGLSLRAFNRWMTAHSLLESDIYVKRLLSEIAKSSDSRLTKKLVQTSKRFPRKRAIELSVLKMISSKQIIFPHQEAECIRALRYLSNLSEETVNHCWDRLSTGSEDRYLRMQAAYLVGRTEIDDTMLNDVETLFLREPDIYVQTALAGLLTQRRQNNSKIIQMLVFHPNEKVSNLGKLFRTAKNDKKHARETLRNSLRPETPWGLCDNMPFIHVMAASGNAEIRTMLLDAIRQPRNSHPIVGLRMILKTIFTRTRESLKDKA